MASMYFEHRFWLQILGDHSRFIFSSLSPKEKAELNKAHYFMGAFDDLLAQAHEEESEAHLLDLTHQAFQEVNSLRYFKLQLIRRHLVDGIELHLTPTFLNHMVNELDEYCLLLHCFLEEKKMPHCHPLHFHTVWLLDASGHAGFLHCNLDDVEYELKKKSKDFQEEFMELYHKALEYQDFLRTGLTKFPALLRFNHQVDREMGLFMTFLQELMQLRLNLDALGTFSPLIVDHMYREECYYLLKLAQLGAVPKPQCDPAKPRLKV